MSNITILLITLTTSSFIIFIVTTKKHNPGASSLILFTIAVSIAALSNFFIYHVPPIYIPLWFAITSFSLRMGYTTILIFVIQYTQHADWLKRSNLILLAIEPVISQLVFWSSGPGKRFFATQINLNTVKLLSYDNPWFLGSTLYANALLLITIFILARDFSYRPLAYRQQTKFILAGVAISILSNNNISSSSSLPIQELKIISLLATGLAFILGYRYAGLFEITPIARESVVEHMHDGWIILDKVNRVVDMNVAAEKIIGVDRNKLSGQPAEKIFIDWPNLMVSLSDTRELDLKGSVKIKNEWVYLNIHTSPLIDADANQFGKLIVWRDITERRLADEARQQARDEMFILLHSITSAASRALNLDDFLAESIYQIVYSSHSQSISVYLLEEHERTSNERYLILAAQHGVPLIPEESHMLSIPASTEIVAWVLEHGEPLLIPDIQIDARIPLPMRDLGPMSLLLIPMMMEGQMLGVIGLTRTGLPPYNVDEIARLTAVTDEVATFIHSNRQRQLSIALAERQRLVRDLHDSVTQKLYGLVTLAEATQAGIQAGVTDMPAKVIVRMAENARQALKEMRLFLFQLQPIDFERDGLAAVLQHRLSAVEGRADINARLTVDDNISLSLEKELALYFIAQEALNNILKHARAKNVTVSLKNKKSNIVLEVEDNGCGFDPKTTDLGGIGMRSMRERAVQIGGKLKISSAPGKGTKITITLKNIDRPGI